MSARKAGSDALSSVTTPALAATVHVARPSATPAAVAIPLRRPPESVFRIVSAVSCPGVQMTTTDTATNAARLPSIRQYCAAPRSVSSLPVMLVVKQAELPWSSIANELVGAEHGLDITLLFVDAEPGRGPALHRHPYPEIFITLEGEATFTVEGERLEVRAGDIVVAHAGEAHAFVNSGTGPLRQVDIHVSPTFSTEWL